MLGEGDPRGDGVSVWATASDGGLGSAAKSQVMVPGIRGGN